MSGYTPVFDSVFHGTLCGRWPTLPVWLTILPLADKHGHIDITHQAISALTGWPLDLLKQAIAELQEPDPDSRSCGEEGRRLVLLDPEHRQWGWRVVNHSQYRERARKQMQQIQATESGRDAERKRITRDKQRLAAHGAPSSDVQPRPYVAGSDRPSDADADADADVEKKAGDSLAGISRPRERPPYERKEFHQRVITVYHEEAPDLPPVKAWPRHRAGALSARIRERCRDGKPADTIDYWREFFQTVAASDFLCGRAASRDGRAPFRADLEWLLRPENFAKVIEGRYTVRRGSNGSGAVHAR
jgi:hypothetical protein